MRQKGVLTIVTCFLGATVAWGQGQALQAGANSSLPAPQDPREPAVLAQCKNPPLPAPDYGDPRLGLRDYKVIEIPGVIAAGQRWKSVWQQMGDNGDGIVGSPDGGLLIAQNDSSDVLKLDNQGKTSIVYTDTNTGGSLSMNSRGALFIVERGFRPSISELAPNRKTLADHYQGDPLNCSGVILNDLMADSKGGAYFTMGGVFYASSRGQITRYDAGNLRGPNGIILSANEKILYVSNGITLVAFDVQPDGSLTNQRDFGKLEAGGFGDGSAIDAQGRIYVTTAPGVQVIAPDGKYLGLIPTPRPVISVAFSGPRKKTLYVLAQGAKDAQEKEVDNAAQVYSIPMIAQGFKKRAK
ncbi:MAG: SMP-30/gluconolactonase/LRE family protein [Acidobacteriaceae bacterium]